jgi:hypothetical protein
MKKYEGFGYYPLMDNLVDILVTRTGARDRSFFRTLTNFYFTQVASNMRCSINTLDRGNIPINFYGISLATSGVGKGYSTNIMVDEVLGGFRKEFMEVLLPFISDFWLDKIANRVVQASSLDYDEALDKVKREYESLGEHLFSFDSGTLAGLRQLRHKLLMGKIGALSFIADEIGTNLTKQATLEVIEAFLDLFDVGKLGDKLLVNSAERKRNKQIYGRTPANMLLFGTPDKLFDGSTTESTFRTLLTTGLSRRCFYAYSDKLEKDFEQSAEEIYEQSINLTSKGSLQTYYDLFKSLADSMHYNVKLTLGKEEAIFLIRYRKDCERAALKIPSIEQEKIAELEHSYFKVLKLAGAYAFIDKSDRITIDHLKYAITCGLDSTKVFQEKIVNQPKPHTRLLKYLCSKGDTPSTLADMANDLPFFPKAKMAREELFTLATSEGYINNITLTHKVENDVDIYIAKQLEETNLSELIVAYSDRISDGYQNIGIEFDELDKLVTYEGYHWINHHLEEVDGNCHRDESSIIQGFNLIVLDLDKNVDVDTARLILQDYTYIIYTTKRHTEEENRFRIIVPTSHIVELDAVEFPRFMRNVYEWLPFEADEQTAQRSRKWLANKGKCWVNRGKKLLDSHQFIPHTNKAKALNTYNRTYTNLPNLERWYLRRIEEGDGRNNTLLKYALVLVDSGLEKSEIMDKLLALNSRINPPMSEARIHSTIGVTVTKRLESQKGQ